MLEINIYFDQYNIQSYLISYLPGYKILLIIPGITNKSNPVIFKADPNSVPALACTIFLADNVLCTINCVIETSIN